MKQIQSHFSRIAGQYANLRTTDIEPINFITNRLVNKYRINAADIGCGVGRYDLKLCDYLYNKLYLICIDNNKYMLEEIAKKLNRNRKDRCNLVNAFSECLPIANDSLDCIFSFNALHHFNLSFFFREVSRILKKNGILFVYTRLRSQNKRNIWGMFFPDFFEKETRLYELNYLKEQLNQNRLLKLDSIEIFRYKRQASLKWLEMQAKKHHYSTFCFYNKHEFDEALLQFRRNLVKKFENLNKIRWYDENIMLVIRRKDYDYSFSEEIETVHR